MKLTTDEIDRRMFDYIPKLAFKVAVASAIPISLIASKYAWTISVPVIIGIGLIIRQYHGLRRQK